MQRIRMFDQGGLRAVNGWRWLVLLAVGLLMGGRLYAGQSAVTAATMERHLSKCDTVTGVWAVPDSVWRRMQGKSYREGCPVQRADLRYVKVRHVNAEGLTCMGELVCNKSLAADLLAIFRALYAARYPIERVRLVDDYGANDVRSMEANNSSAFNYRRVSGSSRLSKHAYGRAIDINPLYNPYVKQGGRVVEPKGGRLYANRARRFRYKIAANDLCVRLFKQYGFTWGGDWRTVKDYQHFER